MLDINSYDKYIVAFSGGKDSTACFLHLLELGIPNSKIELWHHDIDGREGSRLMDWPITRQYCKDFAKAFDVPIYFSWKVGGFECELFRENQLTRATKFETPDGQIVSVGGQRGKLNTRLKFPQVSANLSVRWCSAYLKIDVCSNALRNQSRFDNSKTLLISGERAQESAARSKYKVLEPDRSDNRTGSKKRHVDRWRPIHSWAEKDVWEIIERFKVNPHPAYKIGFGRVSCMTCIFGNKNQWATIRAIHPEKVTEIAELEQFFGYTINREKDITTLADEGMPYPAALSNNDEVERALGTKALDGIFVDNWELPSGAFGESCGPV